MQLHELIYVSLATRDFSSAELLALLDVARVKNARDGITGLLVHHSREFMQLLEGDEDMISRLYEKICLDSRNRQNNLLWEGRIERRAFPDWSMAFVAPRELALEERAGYSKFLESGLTGVAASAAPTPAKMFLLSLREDFLS